MSTRAQLLADMNAKIISGSRSTTAANLRAFETDMIASNVNKSDDLNVAGGYLGIDNTGIVDISFIKKSSPTGDFLKDDGTWATVLTSAPSLNQVLASGNSTFGYSILVNNGDKIRFGTSAVGELFYDNTNGRVVLKNTLSSDYLYAHDAGGFETNNTLSFISGKGIDTTATVGTDVLNIGATNANVINYGNSTTIHNFLGTAIYELQVNSYVTDKLITLNYGGSASSGLGVGFEIEENSLITGYWKTSASRDGWITKLPAVSSTATFDFSTLTSNRTWVMPDSNGTLLLNSTGFVQGGNAFGTTAILGTTDAYDLNFITNNTTVARFTSAGDFETYGGNGTGSNVAIHQSAANAAATGRIIDIYNNSYSKLLFRLSDNGSAGEAYIGNGALQINTYTGVSTFYGSTVVRGQTASGDHLSIIPPTGIGGTYFSDSSGHPRLYIQNASASTVAELLASGTSYLGGGGLDLRATAGSGFLGMAAQSVNASAPSTAGFRLFAGSTGSFNWVRNNGVSDTYVRTFDATLTANRTYTLPDASGTVPLGTGASNRITYWTGTNSLSSDANFIYETSNSVLVVGATASLASTDVANFIKDQNAASALRVRNNNTTALGSAQAFIQVLNSSTALNIGQTGTGFTPTGLITADMSYIQSTTTNGLLIYTSVSGPLIFGTGNTERGRFDTSGNFTIGTSASTTRRLTVTASTAGAEGMLFENRDTGSTGRAFNQIKGQAGSLFLYMDSTGGTYGTLANAAIIDATGSSSPLMYNVTTGNSHTFRIAYAEKAKIDSTGLILAAGTSSTAGLATTWANDTSSTMLKVYTFGSAQAGNYGSTSLTVADKAIIETASTGSKNLIVSAAAFWVFSNATTTTSIGMRVSSTGVLIANNNSIHNAASAPLHVIKTTEQLRIAYDSSNYYSTTVSSAGAVTFDATGSGASFNFSDLVIFGAQARLKSYTVATLPASPTQGDTAFVTDASAPTFLGVIAGGGAVVTPVFYNGTNWVAV